MRLLAADLHRVRLPLVRPFRTSFGEQVDREVLVVRLRTDEGDGWGECAADADPHYSSEFNDGARLVLRDHLVPRLFGAGNGLAAAGVADVLAPVKGHRMAKAALELAVLDAELRAAGTPLAEHLGGVRDAVDVGVSVGITDDPDLLGEWVAGYLDEGYRRIKLKIEPGADIERVAAIRELVGPDFPLQVDANTAYRVTDAEHLARLDEFGLLLVEQPLAEDDFAGHAVLARRLRTPICLDESIESEADVETALALGACGIVNIKPGRVGGLLEARRIHDRCRAADVPVWCGGMLETGIGRAGLVALSALPGFTLPGDSSASDRYYHRDLTEPFVLEYGRLRVPTGPGLGVTVDEDALAAFTAEHETLTPGVTDVEVREVEGMDEIRALAALVAERWGEAFLDPGIARAIQHAGGYVAGAWDGSRMVGGCLAFLGRHDDEVLLHSHATCSAADQAGRGIGLALKWHQRAWCLDRGLAAVEWTYDPLVARNGWFNLTKLAARAVAYEVDFYGRMDTAIERGEESDRCLVRWDVGSEAVADAASGVISRPDVKARRNAGAPVLLDVGPDGGPVPGDEPRGDFCVARVPADIEALRVEDPRRASEWRQALRATVGRAMRDGRHLTAATRDGWYVLEPAPG